MVDLFLIRVLLLAALTATAFFLRPFGLPQPVAAGTAALAGALIILAEMRVRRASPREIAGAVFGALTGILAALLISLTLGSVLSQLPNGAGQLGSNSVAFLELLLLIALAYGGLAVGASQGNLLNWPLLGGQTGDEPATRRALNILDTSVIIDGRIADIAETGFIDGALIIPQFVLRELQMVADSADSSKRNRGRRGLDILQRIQKMPQLDVQIVEEDFPKVREVDLKLIELAKLIGGKVVTNDFNLNKVAQLHGVDVLNINELANSLKPVVLPGEVMRVFILKEGKEPNQGVAYLDDGTMVVVDHARRLISKTIDVTVTSVLQTTAGKMIFGRYDERARPSITSVDRDPEADRSPSEAAPARG